MLTLIQRLLMQAKNRGVFLKVNIEQGEAIQRKTLNKLLVKAQDTKFGVKHNFKELIDSPSVLSDYTESATMGDLTCYPGGLELVWGRKM
jgi:hypothetical protein